jgi:hypothetical protein
MMVTTAVRESMAAMSREEGASPIDHDSYHCKLQETMAARTLAVRWQNRGPAPSETTGLWRGQVYREGKNGGQQRWGNRGGKKRDAYADYYRAVRSGASEDELRVVHPKNNAFQGGDV